MPTQSHHHRSIGRMGAAVGLAVVVGALTAAFEGPAGASPGTRGLVPSAWDCTNQDTTTFLLPAAAVSPGAGAVVAPFPGILTGFEGPAPMTLGTYVLTGAVTTSPVPASFGQKTGVAANGTTTCTLEGTAITVTIAPA